MNVNTKAAAPSNGATASEKNSSSSGNHTTKTTKPSRPSRRKKAGERGRNWATVIYPDSVAEDWQEQLQKLYAPVFVSPLQDADKADNAEGIAKPHRHILFMFCGNKSEAQVREIVNRLNGVGVERIESKIGYARYLCHMDNPEKAQYNKADVLSFGGADYEAAIIKPDGDYAEETKEIIYFVTIQQIYSLAELIQICLVQGRDDWFKLLMKSNVCNIVEKYIKSMTWDDTKGQRLKEHRQQEQQEQQSENELPGQIDFSDLPGVIPEGEKDETSANQ